MGREWYQITIVHEFIMVQEGQVVFTSKKQWYAMSSPYGREMQTVKALKTYETDVESFLPLERFERMTGQKNRTRKISERPVVRNLLFVNATRSKMHELKQRYNTMLQFKMKPLQGGGFIPIIVPDKQMEDFRRLYDHVDKSALQFFSPEDLDKLNLRPNARVRIEDGLFAGIEGYYQQVKGAKGKRFIVKIEGFMACAAFLTECRFISIK